jgi:hypothetical protein
MIVNAEAFSGLDIFIITENTTQKIADILEKASGMQSISTVFGVNGRYGRHYSFLKAIAPIWQLAVDEKIKATFKIDLDQIFAQDVLENETGESALEHFKTALWGATAKDTDGNTIELGMIAGALVNESDINKGLFTPDVAIPEEPLSPMDVLFPRVLAMAISTRAEMMTQYHPDDEINGKDKLLYGGIAISHQQYYYTQTSDMLGLPLVL